MFLGSLKLLYFSKQDECHSEKVTKTIELESEVGQLHTSLLDIAQIVIDDAEKQDLEDLDQSLAMNATTSVFVTPTARTFRAMG